MKSVILDWMAVTGVALFVAGLWIISPACALMALGLVLCGTSYFGAKKWGS